MRTPRLGLAVLLAPILLLACRQEMPVAPAQSLTIYYTASLRGNLDGCDCEHNRVAGLVKRAAYLRAQPAGGVALRLDTGDILDSERDPDLAREILEVYRELAYDAVAVGELELGNGLQALRGYLRRYPLLAHNLEAGRSESHLALLTQEPLLLTRGGIRVGLIGLAEAESFQGRREVVQGTVRVQDPILTAQRMLEAFRRRGADLVIVLYHGSEAGARRLATECPGLDLILFGHQNRLIVPEKVGTALIASPGENGNRLGVLDLRLGPQGIAGFEHRLVAFNFARDPDDPGVRRRVTAYRKLLQARLRAEDAERAQSP
jgi:2',3'-cyclic-nucleotide 2'-phosphodiesterase (5'-nucleotidase family)